MNSEIKARISTLSLGKLPNNYKKYEFDIIPDEWIVKKIGQIFNDLKTGATPRRSIKQYFEGYIPWITSGELKEKFIHKTKEYITNRAVDDTNLQKYEKGTLFIAITGLEAQGIRGTCAINAVEATTNQSCLAFKEKKEIKNEFLYYWYSLYGEYIGIKYTQGTKQQSLNNKLVEGFEIPIPTLQEQSKIIQIISKWDEAIELKEKLLLEKQKQKKGLIEALLTGKIRLNGFNEEWKSIKIDKIIEESKDIENNASFEKLLSVKLHLQGVCKREVTGTEVKGATTVYKRKAGQFIYGKQNFHNGSMGIIPNELDGFASSSDIPSFDFKKGYCSQYFYYYWARPSYYKKLESLTMGTGSKRLNPKEFLNILIKIPRYEEQIKISEVISNADKEVKLLQKEVELLKEQKKGLMQLLLTGIVRVKCN